MLFFATSNRPYDRGMFKRTKLFVKPTIAGDGWFFVVTCNADGTKVVDSVRYTKLTRPQRAKLVQVQKPRG